LPPLLEEDEVLDEQALPIIASMATVERKERLSLMENLPACETLRLPDADNKSSWFSRRVSTP
jgi:hypothetical protein